MPLARLKFTWDNRQRLLFLQDFLWIGEPARLLVSVDHIASLIVNANHEVMRDNLHIHTLIPPKMTRASALGHSGKW